MVDGTDPVFTDVVTIIPRIRADNGRPPRTKVIAARVSATL